MRRTLRRLAGEHGMATAELAMALPVLVLVLAGVLSAVSVGAARVRMEDAAREAARAAARDDPAAAARALAVAPGGRVRVSRTGSQVTATVSASVPLLPGLGPAVTVSAAATAQHEPDPGAPADGSG